MPATRDVRSLERLIATVKILLLQHRAGEALAEIDRAGFTDSKELVDLVMGRR